MGKKMKGRRAAVKRQPAVSGPFAGLYWQLRRLARNRRLFVLFDGAPRAPRLTFFDTTTGRAVLDYWPGSRLWAPSNRPGRGGRCYGGAEAVELAARLAAARDRRTGEAVRRPGQDAGARD